MVTFKSQGDNFTQFGDTQADQNNAENIGALQGGSSPQTSTQRLNWRNLPRNINVNFYCYMQLAKNLLLEMKLGSLWNNLARNPNNLGTRFIPGGFIMQANMAPGTSVGQETNGFVWDGIVWIKSKDNLDNQFAQTGGGGSSTQTVVNALMSLGFSFQVHLRCYGL